MEQKTKTKKVVAKKIGTSKTAAKKKKPTFEQIKERAYQIYVENGYRGNEMENWIKAEKELE